MVFLNLFLKVANIGINLVFSSAMTEFSRHLKYFKAYLVRVFHNSK